jgi:hypothetical protein
MFLKKFIHKKWAIIIAAAIILAACQSGTKPAGNEIKAKDSLNMTEISKDVKDVIYPLPTPFEMTRMLKDIQAAYVSGSLNPANKVEKYFTEKSKAINLGVYGADLAYAATYDQKQDVKIYSKALKNLIDQLGINVDYSQMLSDKFKEKVNNKDTLTKIITNTFYDTYKYLNEKSNPDLAIMMVAGMWVEAMYIATNISEDTYHYSGLVQIIANQSESYTKLMKLLNSRNTDKDIKDLESKLEVLKPSFDKVKSGLMEKDYLLILNTIKSVRKSTVS